MEYVSLISAVQGLLAAISVWQNERDYKLAIQAYDQTKREVTEDPRIQERANVLKGVLPPDVAAVFQDNIDMCWEHYRKCIAGESSNDAHEMCQQANQDCLCSNLRHMSNSNGCLPDEFERLWDTMACGVKPRIC